MRKRTDIKTLLGQNVKFFRKKNKMTQYELSEEVGISVKHLSEIENGMVFVSADLFEKLSASLKTTPSRLLDNQNWYESPEIDEYLFEEIIKIVNNAKKLLPKM